MNPDTLHILQSADDLEGWEYPVSFDRQRELASVRELQIPLEQIAGRAFSIADCVQDASFFAELWTYDEFRLPHGGALLLAVLAVRFSSFGRLFTVWSASPSEAPEGRRLGEVSQDVRTNVTEAVAARGYTYVDAASLQAEYTGVNVHLHGESWWVRFFDYL